MAQTIKLYLHTARYNVKKDAFIHLIFTQKHIKALPLKLRIFDLLYSVYDILTAKKRPIRCSTRGWATVLFTLTEIFSLTKCSG